MPDASWFRASAPVRLDFAGGWTDVAPFATQEHGVVVNAAIDLRARAEVQLAGDALQLDARDLGRETVVRGGWSAGQSSEFPLQKAALGRAGIGAGILRTSSEVPPGSGLGSSGALGVAMVAALDAARGVQRQPVELAEDAFQLEAIEAAMPGGKQDQYAAALGGFHRLRFEMGSVTVDALELDPAFTLALEQHIVVCYTGRSRVSSDTISRVMSAYAGGNAAVVTALRSLAELAEAMAQALVASDLAAIGSLLSVNWRWQQQLDPGMQTAGMRRLEAAMQSAGALGGKAAGAGAGGSMFFVVRGDRRRAEHAAEETGARVIPFRWSRAGVKSC